MTNQTRIDADDGLGPKVFAVAVAYFSEAGRAVPLVESLCREVWRVVGVRHHYVEPCHSVGLYRFGKALRGLETPRHSVLFNRSLLTEALRKIGFCSISKHWRGMTIFNVYASSEAIAAGRLAAEASYRGRPPLRSLLAELKAMLSLDRREFLTLAAL